MSLGNASSYPTWALNATALSNLYPDRVRTIRAETVADQQAAAASEDTALTQRFTAFFTSLLSGKVTTDGLSDAMVGALKPAVVAQLGQYFGKVGSFQRLQYAGEDSLQGYRRYHYNAVFGAGSQPVTFVLNSAGKIDGFFLQ